MISMYRNYLKHHSRQSTIDWIWNLNIKKPQNNFSLESKMPANNIALPCRYPFKHWKIGFGCKAINTVHRITKYKRQNIDSEKKYVEDFFNSKSVTLNISKSKHKKRRKGIFFLPSFPEKKFFSWLMKPTDKNQQNSLGDNKTTYNKERQGQKGKSSYSILLEKKDTF